MWYSNLAHHYEIISSTDPEIEIIRNQNTMTVTHATFRPTCLRLNMGIIVNIQQEMQQEVEQEMQQEIELEIRKEVEPEMQQELQEVVGIEREVEQEMQQEVTQEIKQEIEQQEADQEEVDPDLVSFSVIVPCAENPENVYIGWVGPDFVFNSNKYRPDPDTLIISQNITALPWKPSQREEQEEIGQNESNTLLMKRKQFGHVPTIEYFEDPVLEDLDVEPADKPRPPSHKKSVSCREGDELYVTGPVDHCNSYLVQVNTLLNDKESKCLHFPTK